MFDNAILVLLYNKKMAESNTIKTLLESKVRYSNAILVIWNNGPKHINTSNCTMLGNLGNLGYEVVVEETLNNESLAVIYNRFIAENEANKYILLDDDSKLSPSYILASSEIKKTEVGMPVISSLGEIRSPTIDGITYSTEAKLSLKSKVTAIGSGLIVGADIAEKLKENYNQIFDEKFYLYGVDTTFCLRLFNSKLTNKIKIIPGFDHSLSRLEKEDQKTTRFRRLERSYDTGLTLRYYCSLPKAIFFMSKVSVSTIKRILFMQQHTVDLLPLFKAFLLGKHYRSGK